MAYVHYIYCTGGSVNATFWTNVQYPQQMQCYPLLCVQNVAVAVRSNMTSDLRRCHIHKSEDERLCSLQTDNRPNAGLSSSSYHQSRIIHENTISNKRLNAIYKIYKSNLIPINTVKYHKTL